MRLYKLSRIKNLIVTDEIFSVWDVLTVSGNPIYSNCEGLQIAEIKLHVDPERAYRIYDDFYEGMVEKQPDGSFIIPDILNIEQRKIKL